MTAASNNTARKSPNRLRRRVEDFFKSGTRAIQVGHRAITVSTRRRQSASPRFRSP
jgi:hypothetical protein